jgi:hypothetical protein
VFICIAACSLADPHNGPLSPRCSRRFITSTPPSAATGWNESCRVGLLSHWSSAPLHGALRPSLTRGEAADAGSGDLRAGPKSGSGRQGEGHAPPTFAPPSEPVEGSGHSRPPAEDSGQPAQGHRGRAEKEAEKDDRHVLVTVDAKPDATGAFAVRYRLDRQRLRR